MIKINMFKCVWYEAAGYIKETEIRQSKKGVRNKVNGY